MSDILTKLADELQTFIDTDEDEGGIAHFGIQSVQVGDPGWLVSDEYPYVMVQSGTINPKSETMGRTGYDVITHDYTLSIMVDATDYFNTDASGNDAEGPLEDAALTMFLWFRRFAQRTLGNLFGVRNVTVGSVDFLPDERGQVYARRALLVLTVERQYQHKP